MVAFTGTNFFTHMVGCFLMTLNRFMAVCFPSNYNMFWSPRVLGIVLFVAISISYVVHTDLFLNGFIYENRNGKWILLRRQRPLSEIRIMTAVVVILYEILGIILISITLYGIKKMAPTMRKFRKEVGLVIVMAIDCVLGLSECIYEASFLFGFNGSSNLLLKFIEQNYSLLFFLIVAMNSYSIMFLSSDLRQEALPLFGKDSATGRATVLTEPPSVIVAPSQRFCHGFLYLIAVYTRVNEPEARLRFRRSYGSLSSKYNFTVLFPLGTADEKTNDAILRESYQFGDILQTNFTDSFHNLTLKSYSFSNFVRKNCTSVRAVLKLDDDVEWNARKVFAEMATIDVKGKRLYCECVPCGIPERTCGRKYFVSWAQWPHQSFPPYCVSATYFGSPSTFVALHDATSTVRHIWLDDVFSTGVVGSAAGLSYKRLNFKNKYSYREFIKGTTFTYGVKKNTQYNRTFLFNSINGNATTIVT
ncbi:hypothetical protein Y032_0071g524 [Ancylostoma ceylanicum]|nr:hypothetical protein Y032_0071g524 [Ancylostoma ceylanicum]